MLGHVNGGERRVGERAHREVVESDDRHVAGHVDPVLGERAHRADGEHVVVGEERRGQLLARRLVEPRAHVLVRGLERRAQDHAPCGIGHKAGVLERLAVTALAILEVADAQLAGEVADLAVTLLDQIVDGAQGRVVVVDDHGIEILAVAPAVEHDQMRRGVREQGEILLAKLGAHKHDGGRGVRDQTLDLRADGIEVREVERHERGAHTVAARLALHALDHGGMERALVEDGARLAREHELDALELRRLLVAERLRALEDDLGGLLAHAAFAVERVRDGRGREAGDSADLADTGLWHGSPYGCPSAAARPEINGRKI